MLWKGGESAQWIRSAGENRLQSEPGNGRLPCPRSLQEFQPIPGRDERSSTVAPEVDPPLHLGSVLEPNRSEFPAKKRSLEVGRIESLQVVDAGKRRFWKLEQFPMHCPHPFHQSGIVSEVAQFAGRGGLALERGSAQSRGVGLTALQGSIDEQEAGGNIGGKIVVMGHECPNATTSVAFRCDGTGGGGPPRLHPWKARIDIICLSGPVVDQRTATWRGPSSGFKASLTSKKPLSNLASTRSRSMLSASWKLRSNLP